VLDVLRVPSSAPHRKHITYM